MAAAALLSACAQPVAGDRRVGDPPTFVSLNPCLDAILVEVAQPEQILALSHYSRDPASSSIPQDVALRFAYTGGTAEEVLALDPDIVLASSFIPAATRASFERLGLRVETFGSPNSLPESYTQIATLARLARHDAKAGELIARIETALRASASATKGRSVETILWQPGQIVAGDSSLVTQTLNGAGFVRAEGLQQGDYVSLETMLADPPQVLLVSGSSPGQDHPSLKTLNGTQVDTLDPSLFFCGGPSLIALSERLDEIRAGLKP